MSEVVIVGGNQYGLVRIRGIGPGQVTDDVVYPMGLPVFPLLDGKTLEIVAIVTGGYQGRRLQIRRLCRRPPLPTALSQARGLPSRARQDSRRVVSAVPRKRPPGVRRAVCGPGGARQSPDRRRVVPRCVNPPVAANRYWPIHRWQCWSARRLRKRGRNTCRNGATW